MSNYYTRACNFYYGSISAEKVKKKLSLPLHGNKLISFDNIEIISRKSITRINFKKVKKLKSQLRKKYYLILNKFQKKKNLEV